MATTDCSFSKLGRSEELRANTVHLQRVYAANRRYRRGETSQSLWLQIRLVCLTADDVHRTTVCPSFSNLDIIQIE